MAPIRLIWTREGCGQLYGLGALFLEKEPPLCMENEEGWILELVWTHWTEDDSIAPRTSKPITPSPHQLLGPPAQCMHRSQIGFSSVHLFFNLCAYAYVQIS
jgi:hypothetical protein